MMHPLGSYSNTANLVELIQAGSHAAKAVFPETKIIIHRANGADSGVDPFYAGLVEAGLKDSDYDIIGLSYYPDSIYTSSINELSSNMNLLAAKYGKEVMVVEVGGDVSKSADNVYNMLVAVQNGVKAVPGGQGTGVFYWAPEESISAMDCLPGIRTESLPSRWMLLLKVLLQSTGCRFSR